MRISCIIVMIIIYLLIALYYDNHCSYSLIAFWYWELFYLFTYCITVIKVIYLLSVHYGNDHYFILKSR